MTVMLTIQHVDGIRLRQQLAHDVQRVANEKGGNVIGGKEWHFADEIQRDVDPRRRDNNGAPLQLPTYTFYVSYGMKNVVIEKKGKPENLTFRNAALRNQLRIKIENFVDSGRKDKNGKPVMHWTTVTTQYVPANEWTGVCVGDGIRAIVDEQPT